MDYCYQCQGHSEGLKYQWMLVQMISSKLPNIFKKPNLVLWCIIMSRSVMQEDWFAIFKVKVTARAHLIKIWQFLIYPLNCWSSCYQTWIDHTLSQPRVSYEEIGLLCSWSRSQQNFKMSVNVCPDDIFWTDESFTHHHHHHHQSLNCEGRRGTTNDFATCSLHFSLFSSALWDLLNSRPVHFLTLSSHLFLCLPCLLPHHEPDCLSKSGLLSSRSRSQWRIIQSEYDFLTYLLNCRSFCNKTWFDGHGHNLDCLVKR